MHRLLIWVHIRRFNPGTEIGRQVSAWCLRLIARFQKLQTRSASVFHCSCCLGYSAVELDREEEETQTNPLEYRSQEYWALPGLQASDMVLAPLQKSLSDL